MLTGIKKESIKVYCNLEEMPEVDEDTKIETWGIKHLDII